MNVFEIIKAHLETTGLDGIYNVFGGCACDKSDLSPGDCLSGECRPGRLFTCCGCKERIMRNPDEPIEQFACADCRADDDPESREYERAEV